MWLIEEQISDVVLYFEYIDISSYFHSLWAMSYSLPRKAQL